MKKKLPVMGKPTPASAQKGLAATPVKGASRPDFPTRSEAYLKAGLLGGAALIAGCGSPSHATTTPPPSEPVAAAPAPAPEAAPQPTPAPALCEHEQVAVPIADRVGNALWRERNPVFLQKLYPQLVQLRVEGSK